jgi:hypothetical protein
MSQTKTGREQNKSLFDEKSITENDVKMRNEEMLFGTSRRIGAGEKGELVFDRQWRGPLDFHRHFGKQFSLLLRFGSETID